jgi:hypothetical protein
MLPYGVDDAIGDGDDGSKAGGGSGNNDAPLTPLERAKVFLAAVAQDRGRFDSHATPGLTAVACTVTNPPPASSSSSSSCRLRCELPFSRAVTNRYGGLHGGCAATLVDVAATAALAALTDRAGVSLSITTHYHRPVVPLPPPSDASSSSSSSSSDTVIVVDADVVKVGKHVAAVDVTIRTRPSGGGGGGGGGGAAGGGVGVGGVGGAAVGPVLVSGTHVKALVARSDVGALFQRPSKVRSRL